MNDIPICDECGQRHVVIRNGQPISPAIQACTGHVVYDRETYQPGKDREKLPQPRPCQKAPSEFQAVCWNHGGASPQALAVASDAKAQHLAERALRRKLGDKGTPITDPIATLCAIGGRAVKFMETLGETVDDLAEIRSTDKIGAEQLRAEIALYRLALKDAAGIVESIVRAGIAERFAKQNAEMTQAVVSFIDGVLTDLGHNPRDPEVAGAVAKRLELVS